MDHRRKYFFFDIDGTLAAGTFEHRFVPESTREALAALRQAGHFTAIATGRAHAMAQDIFEEEGFAYMVSDGGNSLVIDKRFTGVEPLDYDACVAVLDECEARGIAWALSYEDAKERITPDGRFDPTHHGYMTTRIDPDLDYRCVPQFLKLYIACDAAVESTIDSLQFVPHARQTERFLFVEPVDKARGIVRMIEEVGGSIEDVVVFGDGANDLMMFDKRWTSIAMGNACQALKDKADYVTADVDKDGIFLACKHYGWI